MHIVQISSSELFARCAAELKLEVAITRYVTSLWRTTPDNRVVAGQQLALDYQIKFSDPEKGSRPGFSANDCRQTTRVTFAWQTRRCWLYWRREASGITLCAARTPFEKDVDGAEISP